MNQNKVLSKIDNLQTLSSIEEVELLEQSLTELFNSPNPENGIESLFKLFERFPDSDGFGLFWTMLHSIEEMPNYEHALVKSVQRHPAEFNLLMVERLLHSNVKSVEGTDLLMLLGQVAGNNDYSESIRRRSQEMIESFEKSRPS
jgi:adenine C2-methylase RlmN of 23S rRNA A2503 and tRNA A37